MNFYNNIKTVQIETSSLCNAACPQCMREWWDGDYSRFKQTYIPTEFYETRIPQHVYDTIEKIDLCGTIGDPCMAPNLIDIVQVIKRKNPNIKISIATNGGMRTPEWWSKLASVLTTNDEVIFGIDGLEDTNWIYRVNVQWNKLIANVAAFINGGGVAHWQFIVFAHNEHQIEIARAMSTNMKFTSFFTIPNNRFVVENMLGRKTFGANNQQLAPPKDSQNMHVLVRRDPIKISEWHAAAEKKCITCKAQQFNEVYIDVETHLLPCCHIASAKIMLDPLDEYDGFYTHWQKHGNDKIKLDYHNWDTILDSSFYSELKESWTKPFKQGRMVMCSGVCSTESVNFDTHKNKHE